MRLVGIAVAVLVMMPLCGAGAAEVSDAAVFTSSCLSKAVSENEVPVPGVPDPRVTSNTSSSACWEVLCFYANECGHPCESAYCDFRFGYYGYCQEW